MSKQASRYALIMAAGALMLAAIYCMVRPERETAETEAETAVLPLADEKSDNLTVKILRPEKVGNFDAERVVVTLPATTEATEEITTEEPETTAETTEAQTDAPTEYTEAQTEAEELTEAEEIPEPETEEIPETEGGTEADIITTVSQKCVKVYSCHGVALDPDLQRFAYDQLAKYGMEDYYEVLLCQAYQESSYHADQRTLNHGEWDCGLMQIREKYWAEWSAESGITGDILNPWINMDQAIYILSRYWKATGGNVEQTISMYMSGWSAEWMGDYVSAVLSHREFLQEIEG